MNVTIKEPRISEELLQLTDTVRRSHSMKHQRTDVTVHVCGEQPELRSVLQQVIKAEKAVLL